VLLDTLPLLILLLFVFLWIFLRLRYRLRCPECGSRAELATINIGYQLSNGNKSNVSVKAAACLHCRFMWTLRDTTPRKSNLVILGGTRFRTLD
jgi:hypothetical protein